MVDDNQTNRRIMQGILKRWGAQTTTPRAEERRYLNWISAGKIRTALRLVVTDMHMPDMDGFGLVEQMRRNPELSAGDCHDAHFGRSSRRCGALPAAGNSLLSLQAGQEAGIAGSDPGGTRAILGCLSLRSR